MLKITIIRGNVKKNVLKKLEVLIFFVSLTPLNR